MKRFVSKLALIPITLATISGGLAPLARAQDIGTVVHISSNPDGGMFNVDGQNYTHAMSAIWPTGSKHTLSVPADIQGTLASKSQFTFKNWSYSGGTVPGGDTVVVTADPNFTTFQANFDVQYALSLNYIACPDPSSCFSPGTVYVGTAPYTSNADIWASAGSTLTLMAVPSAGYVFSNWLPGQNQVVTGYINKVTMLSPTSVSPVFQKARTIKLDTVPSGLLLYADRTQTPTPSSFDWGWNSTHSIGVISPQKDNVNGYWWVFQSWSDGGASTHAYTVGQQLQPDSLVATFVRGAGIVISTLPQGLSLKIDGRSNWPSDLFEWGVGETHRLEAPMQQTDAQGRLWNFSGWSNGGSNIQDYIVPAIAVDNGGHLTASYTLVGHLTINGSLAALSVKVDGQDCPTPCDVQRPVGTTVRLSAPGSIPQGDGSRMDFLGWPGSGSLSTDWSFTLNGDPQALNASYHSMNKLSALSSPPQGASWTIQPSSADGFYDAQTTVNVLVSALPGFRFHAWSGDLTGTKPAGAVAMNVPRSVLAQLDRIPYIAPAGVGNAAGTTPQSGVAAGSVVSIFGASMASAAVTGPTSPLVQTLGGVTVRVMDRFLPLFYVSDSQINVQLPDDFAPGNYNLTLSSTGLPDVQAAFTVVRNAPGLFSQVANGQAFAVAFHEDGTPVTTDAPAISGELLTVYGTGFGPADHARPEGFPVPAAPPFLLLDGANVSVGSFSVNAENAFAVPGQVGLDAVQFRLGDGAPTGTNAALQIHINGQDSNVVVLPVQ